MAILSMPEGLSVDQFLGCGVRKTAVNMARAACILLGFRESSSAAKVIRIEET